MPVFHFVYHAYRSWNAGHPEGWHQHGEPGKQRPQVGLGRHRDFWANQPAMVFGEGQQGILVELVMEVCGRHGWRVHCASVDSTHVHAVVSWRGGEEPDAVKDRLKNLLSLLLNRREGVVGRRVFSKKSGDTRVLGRKHLTYLKEEYLPGHEGVFWCED